MMGHLTGDQVLKRVASRLTAGLPASGQLARWGGDEFVAVVDRTGACRGRGVIEVRVNAILVESAFPLALVLENIIKLHQAVAVIDA